MNFMGMEGFAWFTGVVEERQDPLRLGRVKVRMFGLHSAKKSKGETEGIPTEDLPWAYPMQPITSAAVNGIGTTPLGPVEGTHVVGFFRDGKNCQDPVVMGTLGGFPLEEAGVAGFNDPNKLYPKRDYLKEPDTNRRAVVDFIDPLEKKPAISKETPLSEAYESEDGLAKKRAQDKKVPKAMDTTNTWDEPLDPYAAQYPFNHVRESESGHIEEWDDTPEAERLMKWHKSGTFEEVHPSGQRVFKVVRNNYTIITGDDFVHIKKRIDPDTEEEIEGNLSITVDGNCDTLVRGDNNLHVEGNYNVLVEGNWNVDVLKNTTIKTVGVKNDESALNHNIRGKVVHLNQ